MKLNHIGTSPLETDRLFLRKFRLSDISDMYSNWASDDEVTKHLGWPKHESLYDTKKSLDISLENYKYLDNYNWAIQLKESNTLIGNIALYFIDNFNLSAEVGYCLGKSFWNNGYMTEALNAVIDFCFNFVGFNRLTGCCITWHNASANVLTKAGMKFEGVARQKYLCNSGFHDFNCYSILKSDLRK